MVNCLLVRGRQSCLFCASPRTTWFLVYSVLLLGQHDVLVIITGRYVRRNYQKLLFNHSDECQCTGQYHLSVTWSQTFLTNRVEPFPNGSIMMMFTSLYPPSYPCHCTCSVQVICLYPYCLLHVSCFTDCCLCQSYPFDSHAGNLWVVRTVHWVPDKFWSDNFQCPSVITYCAFWTL